MVQEINPVRNISQNSIEISNRINWGIGVKAVIVENKKVLMIRRRLDDPHNPGLWDLPGGRIQPIEAPQQGLIRETKEETDLDITVSFPLDVHHFTRQDGQVINLIFFLCRRMSDEIKLSHEHIEYLWVDINSKEFEFPKWFEPVLKNLLLINTDRLEDR
jgi:8-oxo-dGTP diphosphatase